MSAAVPDARERNGAAPGPGDRLPPVLRRRREFLACARARKWSTPGMIVQGRERPAGEAAGIRVGFTASKKVGGAVQRNRAKRRLREAARAILARQGRAGWDYVLIARHEATAARAFPALVADLASALDRLHRPPRPRT